MGNLFEGQSKWQENKDEIILKRIEANPERETELLALSDKADKIIIQCRIHNNKIENRGDLRWKNA